MAPGMHGLSRSCIWAGRQLGTASYPQFCAGTRVNIRGESLGRCWTGEAFERLVWAADRAHVSHALCLSHRNGVLSSGFRNRLTVRGRDVDVKGVRVFVEGT